MRNHLILIASASLFCWAAAGAQRSSGPSKGTLIVDGGGATEPVVREFARLAGGASASIVVIPTGASSFRFGPDKIILNPDWPRDRSEWRAYETHVKQWFGVDDVTVLHTRDRAVADSEAFAQPLTRATGVFLSAGNAGR